MRWYKPNGETFDKRGTQKAIKEYKLVPSVTSITDVEAKPGLIRYFKNQSALAAEKTLRLDKETDKDYLNRVDAVAALEGEKAAQLGTTVHDFIAQLLKGAERMDFGDLHPIMSPVVKFLLENEFVGECEKVLVGNQYGGKVDFIGDTPLLGRCMVDWKTMKTVGGEKIKPRNDWGPQLAGYTGIYGGSLDVVVNVVISSTEPGRIEVIKYDTTEMLDNIMTFRDLLSVLRRRKKLI